MPGLHVLCLEGDELARAYPLVRSAVGVASDRWREFAGELIGDGGGVLGAKADAECLYGLATFRPLDTLRHARALYVELLVAIDLGRRHSVRDALHKGLVDVARERNCPSIVVNVPTSTRAAVRAGLKAQGFLQESTGWSSRSQSDASS